MDILSSDTEDHEDDHSSEVDDESHHKLLEAISSLDSKRKKKLKQRTEPGSKIEDYNLTASDIKQADIFNLTKSLHKSGKHVSLKKQLRAASKQKLLAAPLSKPEAERVQRTVAYEQSSKRLDKWNNIVQTNRLADQIVYPLKQPDFRLQTTEQFVKRIQSRRNVMESEIDKLLGNSKKDLAEDTEYTEAEQAALKAMNLEEAIERRNELRKMRALQSYQESKARRQNKIKSKKYHRILKKDRLKKELKEFEELQKTNPELALEKLDEIDKKRVNERMSLKHKNTGKWAKQQMLRAKYDVDSREALREQLEISRKLSEKTEALSESEQEVDLMIDMEVQNENDAGGSNGLSTSDRSSNPWMSSVRDSAKDVDSEQLENYNDREEFISESLSRKSTIEEYDELEKDEDVIEDVNVPKIYDSKADESTAQKKKVEVDPTNFISLESKEIKSREPDLTAAQEEVLDNEPEDDQYMTIAEAFADDDVVEEFRTEKEAVVNEDMPKDIDLTLPGWGSWSGPGVKVSKKKRRRFIIKAKPAPPRKDSTLGNVIINEQANKQLASHLVRELPHPFKTAEDFRNSIRMPLGKTWNTETAFEALNKSKVVTKLGTVIPPMDIDILAQHEKAKLKKERHNRKSKKIEIKK